MNLIDKVLEKIDKEIEVNIGYANDLGIEFTEEFYYYTLSALRRQVSKHKADENYDLFCVECENNFSLTGGALSVEIGDCVVAKEVATDLGIGVEP